MCISMFIALAIDVWAPCYVCHFDKFNLERNSAKRTEGEHWPGPKDSGGAWVLDIQRSE